MLQQLSILKDHLVRLRQSFRRDLAWAKGGKSYLDEWWWRCSSCNIDCCCCWCRSAKPNWRICLQNVPKHIQESSKRASSTSCVPTLNETLSSGMLVYPVPSQFDQKYGLKCTCNQKILRTYFILRMEPWLPSRTTYAKKKILSYRATYHSNCIPCILNSHILSEKGVNFLNGHIIQTHVEKH